MTLARPPFHQKHTKGQCLDCPLNVIFEVCSFNCFGPISIYRAATHTIAKITDFRDLRTCQKGPKSEQKRPKLGLMRNQVTESLTALLSHQ